MFILEHYVTADGVDIFERWFNKLEDNNATRRIFARLDRLEAGIFGDCKPVGSGVWELRVDYGPGYRVYYSMVGKTVVLLLCGGDKRKQNADIERAVDYLKDYKWRHAL